MIHIVNAENIGAYADQVMQMHRLRYRVFAERLNWEVQTSGDMEFDIYDTMSPTYLLSIDDDGIVRGSLRLLPTTGPYMLKDVFPVLLGGHDAPSDPRILESSRFAVDHEIRGEDRSAGVARTTYELFLGLIEVSLEREIGHIVTVVDQRMEIIIKRSRMAWERYGKAYKIGNVMTVAGLGEMSRQTLAAVRARTAIEESVIHRPQQIEIAA